MSFKCVPFLLCHSDTVFLLTLCFLHSLPSLCPRRVLALPLCLPLCLHRAMPSQLPDVNLSSIFTEKFLLTSSPSPTPPAPPHPRLSESCHCSHSPTRLFQSTLHNLKFTFVHVTTQACLFPRWTSDFVRAGNTSVSAQRCMHPV